MYRNIWASNWQATKLARDIILSMISLHMIVHVSWFGKTGFESLKNELARPKFGKRVKRDAIRSYMIIIAGNFFFLFFWFIVLFQGRWGCLSIRYWQTRALMFCCYKWSAPSNAICSRLYEKSKLRYFGFERFINAN